MGHKIFYTILWLLIFNHIQKSLSKIFPGPCSQPYTNTYYISSNNIFHNWNILAILPELEDGGSFFNHTHCWITNKEEDFTIGCKNIAMVYRTSLCGRHLLKFCLDGTDIQSREHTMYIMERNLSFIAQNTYFNCQEDTKWSHWFIMFIPSSQSTNQEDEFIIFWGCRDISNNSTHNEGAFILVGDTSLKSRNVIENLWDMYLNFTKATVSDLIITENLFSKPCFDDFQCKQQNNFSCNNFILSEQNDVHSAPAMAPTKLPPAKSSSKTIFLTILCFLILMAIIYKAIVCVYFNKNKNRVAPQGY